MKKKFMLLITAVLAAGMICACGNNNEVPGGEGTKEDELSSEVPLETQEGVIPLKDMKVEDYVSLGVYNGIEVSVTAKSVVSESDVEGLMEQAYFESVTQENGGITDRAVEEGDTVIIDYVGKLDGVAFEGGTDSGSSLTIGSGRFIEGFEEGLIGVMPGVEIDLPLTFPEEYHNADMAGKEVVFTVTVNYIIPTEMSDQVVEAWGDAEYKNLEEFRRYVQDYLESAYASEYEASVEDAVFNQFIENCAFFEIPEWMLEAYENNMRTNLENVAAMYGVDADTYTGYYFNTTVDGFIDAYLEESAKQSLAFQAVANAEELNISDEELDANLLLEAVGAGYATVEEYVDKTQRESYRESYMFEKVMEFLVENAVVTDL